jgi:hypothetical protein
MEATIPAQDISLTTQQVADLGAVCARQRALIAILKSRDEDTNQAEALLRTFEESLAQVSDRLRQLRDGENWP